MFRIVTDFVEKPTLLIMCDERTCGAFSAHPVSGPDQAANELAGFIQAKNLEGWIIAIDRHICPAHVKLAKQRDSRIHLPELALRN